MSKMMDAFEWLQGFDSGKKWFNTLQSPKTKEIYVSCFKRYCDFTGKNPDELIALKIDGLRNVASPKEFQAEDLLDNYLDSANLTDNIKVSTLTAVKSFYRVNWRELNSNVGKKVEAPEPKQRAPKLKDVVELDAALSNHRDHAVIWFVESTPFRQGTICKLVWNDLKSTAQLLKEIRDESAGQITRTMDEDSEPL